MVRAAPSAPNQTSEINPLNPEAGCTASAEPRLESFHPAKKRSRATVGGSNGKLKPALGTPLKKIDHEAIRTTAAARRAPQMPGLDQIRLVPRASA